MVNLDVIHPITDPTDYVSQLVILVIAEKRNVRLRIGLDRRDQQRN